MSRSKRCERCKQEALGIRFVKNGKVYCIKCFKEDHEEDRDWERLRRHVQKLRNNI